jgi:hypothetical protein
MLLVCHNTAVDTGAPLLSSVAHMCRPVFSNLFASLLVSSRRSRCVVGVEPPIYS